MDAAPPATVASKVAKHVRKGERTTSRKMRNFLLDAAEAWVQCVSTRRWIRTRGGANPVCGSRVTCEDGSRALMAREDDAAALVPSNPRVKKDEHDSGESETPWRDLQTFLTNPSLFFSEAPKKVWRKQRLRAPLFHFTRRHGHAEEK